MHGKLYIVATPIGNLEDITIRALRVLKEVGVIFAEDTRVTRKLMSRYEIHTPLERLDSKVETKKIPYVQEILESGRDIALVSDAGTPGISDPGGRLVKSLRESGFTVIPIPGASALVSALSVAGLHENEFIFLGFPPHKKGRKTFFDKIPSYDLPVIFFESPHRIIKTLTELDRVTPERNITVARELTKIHEEIRDGKAEDHLRRISETNTAKGEFVLIVTS